MLYRKVPKTGDELSVLGFGYMRLPLKKGGGIDEERAIRQLRYADRPRCQLCRYSTCISSSAGARHVLARALADGYRKKVRLATKLPPWSVRSREDMDHILDAQLTRLNTDHIDYYLLHSLSGVIMGKDEKSRCQGIPRLGEKVTGK